MINYNLYEKEIDENGVETYKPFDFNNVTICGRKIEQIMQILNGLDLEKENELLLTMENLNKWCEIISEDIKKQQEKVIKNMLDRMNNYD